MKSNIVLAVILFLAMNANAGSMERVPTLCGENTFQDLKMENCQALKLVPTHLPEVQQGKVAELADDSTDIWPDTILEGDIDTNFEGFAVDSVVMILASSNNEVLGYRIQFSYQGWETTCVDDNYDANKPETYKDCKMGKITQTIFVDPDFRDYEIVLDAELEIFQMMFQLGNMRRNPFRASMFFGMNNAVVGTQTVDDLLEAALVYTVLTTDQAINGTLAGAFLLEGVWANGGSTPN